MKRRDFVLHLAAALPLATFARVPCAEPAASSAAPWRRFELTTDVEIADPAGATQLWLPLPLARAGDYQRRVDLRWQAPGAQVRRVALPHAAGELLQLEWPDAKSVQPVKLISTTETRDRHSDRTRPRAVETAGSTELQSYLRPTRYLPTDGIVGETAQGITRGRHDPIDQARAIYAWVVEHTTRDASVRGCGTGDVGSMLASGNLGGKCADINGLFVALARAAGIPARDAYGIRVADSRLGYHCLGKSGDISKAQHCRAEFYAAGHGWIAVDPADVRKVMLEEAPGGLGADDVRVSAARTMLFGNWEMNWIAYNHGQELALPGSHKAAIPFLMYPHGESAGVRRDSLDPANFRYSISSREIVV